jgi:TetR/AcrR family transcriptional regulator
MGRPIDTEKRSEICRNAVEFLRENGLNTSMAKLAEGLGIKRPTLLYYFPDRIAIFEQALTDLLAEQAVFVVGRLMEHDHPIDQLYAQVCAVHEFHHERENRVLFLTQALAVGGSERTRHIVEIGNQVFAAHRQALTNRIRDGVEAGIIHPCDPDSLIRICRAAIDGLLVQRVMTGCDLKPVHQLLWEGLLQPLKREPQD